MSLDDEFYKNKIGAYLQALCATRLVKGDNIPSEIEEGLYLGSIGAAHNKEVLKCHNITHILVVARSLEPAYPKEFTYMKIGVLDSSDVNLACHFENCFNFIEQAKNAGGRVLVHCFAGKSRSVTILSAYLMKKHCLNLNQALDLIRSKRPQIAPNLGFLAQLKNFEKSIQEAKETIGFADPETSGNGPLDEHGEVPRGRLNPFNQADKTLPL